MSSLSIPVWALFGFAVWTLLLLFATVGVYRWSRILSGRASVREWTAETSGDGWYPRAMRAHANCVENLPVFAAIVFVATQAQVDSLTVNAAALGVLAGRVAQSIVHVGFRQTEFVAVLRFSLFLIQALGMLVIAGITLINVIR